MHVPPDRFLAFAFAAADLLVETGLDGTISFAAGAFASRFGAEPDKFVGSRISRLFAPADQAALAMAMASVTLRGRIAPLILRVADAAGTPFTVSAMMRPGPPARLAITLGPVPASPDVSLAGGKPGGFETPLLFVREAELALRAGGGGQVGLVELEGWAEARARLTLDDLEMVRGGIAAAFKEAGAGVLAGEIADGRYGILGGPALDVADMAARIRDIVGASPIGRHAKVSETTLSLAPADLTPAQAARTLRYAVTRFTAGGSAAMVEEGAAEGLGGIIAASEIRARAMREAIAARRFRLQFQPIVALDGLQVHHYEALLRPVRLDSYPSASTQDFVLFAEMVGLSEELDLTVLSEAIAALRAAPAASVAVNISGLSMQSHGFRARVADLLADALDVVGPEATPHRLLVELTETAEIEDMTQAAGAIAAFRDLGVPVCLDDFGAGGAAFRYLREFGVDYVKIDGLYVRAATRGARERGFVASMVELAGTVGARVVAEMIETEEQAALMRDLGVQFGQGWLFGRPGTLPGARR